MDFRLGAESLATLVPVQVNEDSEMAIKQQESRFRHIAPMGFVGEGIAFWNFIYHNVCLSLLSRMTIYLSRLVTISDYSLAFTALSPPRKQAGTVIIPHIISLYPIETTLKNDLK